MVESQVYPHGDNSFPFKLHNAYQTFNTMMLLLCGINTIWYLFTGR